MTTLRRISSVLAVPPYLLYVTWRDGGHDVVDMTNVVQSAPFARLRDANAFVQVTVVDHGSGIEWNNGLDYSSDSLASLAAEQTEVSAASRPAQ